MVSGRPLVELSGVAKIFPLRGQALFEPQRSIRAVDHVSLAIERGQSFGLVGESGCGKSTLGRIVLGLIQPTSGTVLVDGDPIVRLRRADLSGFRRKVQIIHQNPYTSLNPSFTVRQILWEGYRHNPRARNDRRGQYLSELLELVRLPTTFLDRFPNQLSGGQRQRVGIARALSVDPQLIVCDEPTSALDVTVQAQVLNLLADLQERLALTYLFISHDLGVVRYLCDRVAVMYLGRIVEQGEAEHVLANPAHPYTQGLVAASPSADAGRPTGPPPLRGELPDPASPPSGCHFRTRCPFAMDICTIEEPRPRRAVSGQLAACHLIADEADALEEVS